MPIEKLSKVWKSLFRKSLHGHFSIKDFMRDAMTLLVNRPDETFMLQQPGAGDILNSLLRKVFQIVSSKSQMTDTDNLLPVDTLVDVFNTILYSQVHAPQIEQPSGPAKAAISVEYRSRQTLSTINSIGVGST